jgi:exopolysaccharide biosynthesis WecB/TagA/CpsF family protein
LSEAGEKVARSRFGWSNMGALLNDEYDRFHPKGREQIRLLNVPFDVVSMPQAIDRIAGMITNRQPHYVATANVDFTAQVRHDGELRKILDNAHLVICDGTPLVWLSRLLGRALPERVAGSDLVPQLLDRAEHEGWSVYFLGGEPDSVEKAIRNVTRKHSELKIAGAYSPPFTPLEKMDHEGICDRIRQANPDILLVSFGCPKQEKWISRNYQSLGVPVCIGVGATIDFLAGAVKRAPRWMQVAGLEWVFRLAQEPRRLLKRYATDFLVFATGSFREVFLNLVSFNDSRRA